jgi:hypothetical protein
LQDIATQDNISAMELSTTDGYRDLLEQISRTYTQGRVSAVQAVNARLIETYWQVGQHIVEFEQGGKIRADYGKALISSLATDLGLRHGKGFSRSNLIRIRQFYLAYPKGATLSHLFSWSHIVELLKIDDPLERSIYEQQIALTLADKGTRHRPVPVPGRQQGQGRHPATRCTMKNISFTTRSLLL